MASGSESRRRRLRAGLFARRRCVASGPKHIDLYYQHRVDIEVPIEETWGGWPSWWLPEGSPPRHLRASAESIRRANAVHPITALQSEWSLWSRDIEDEIVPTARELGIGLVPTARRPRLSDRGDPLDRRPRARRFPPPLAALRRRELPHATSTGEPACESSPRPGDARPASSRSRGSCTRATTSPRSPDQADRLPRGERRRPRCRAQRRGPAHRSRRPRRSGRRGRPLLGTCRTVNAERRSAAVRRRIS